jgi:hypothetical protein
VANRVRRKGGLDSMRLPKELCYSSDQSKTAGHAARAQDRADSDEYRQSKPEHRHTHTFITIALFPSGTLPMARLLSWALTTLSIIFSCCRRSN